MATKTFVEKFPKATISRDEVETARQASLDAGATSAVITEDSDNWILTTVFSSVDAEASGQN